MKTFKLGVINFLCLAVIIIYIIIAGYYQVWKDVGWLAGETPPYYKTRDYAQNVQNNLSDLAEYIRLRENFEKDGEIDSGRLVDIYNYAELGTIDGSVHWGLAYTLQQLIDWSKQKESYKWWAGYIEKNKEGSYDSAKLGAAKGTLDELYPPRGFDSLPGFVISDKNIKRNNEEQWKLELVLCLLKVHEEMEQYLQLSEKFKSENTNIKYTVENLKTGQVYTNISSDKEKENSARLLFQGDSYFLDTDIPLDYNMSYDVIRNIRESLHDAENYKLSVWIDRSFPIKDELWGGNQFYKKWSFFIKTFPLGLVLITLAFLASAAALCMAAGKQMVREKSITWHLDRVPVEMILIPMGFLIYLAAMIAKDGLGRILPPPQATLRVIGLIGMYSVFLICMLSLVRRRKQRTLSGNSILCQVFRNYKSGLITGRRAVLAAALFAAYVLAVIIGSGMGPAGITGVIFLNLYVGGIIIREVAVRTQLQEGTRKIAEGDFTYKIPLDELDNIHLSLAENINQIGDNLEHAVQESVRNERRKTDLITNVSHDLKTPLTSIISYVNLLKRENSSNPKIEEYVEILEKKTERLKVLMDDLVAVSRINSGNFPIQNKRLDFREFIQQVQGEFYEQFDRQKLQMVNSIPDYKVYIYGDGRALWRVMENLYGNIVKYAMPGSRVYADMKVADDRVFFDLKNISNQSLNIDADELMERFTQGDESRSTEGSGLGLSIARNLVVLMGGTFDIYLDGDLFKASISFPLDVKNGVVVQNVY